MNKETINRLQEAKKYEMMALKALFPEQVATHIDVIEKEIKNMVQECLLDLLKEEKSEMPTQEKNKESKKVKKVNIG